MKISLIIFIFNFVIQKKKKIFCIDDSNVHDDNPDDIILKSTRTRYNIIDSDTVNNDPISSVELIFDTPIFQHEDLLLECRYRLNVNKKLYSIKWYVCLFLFFFLFLISNSHTYNILSLRYKDDDEFFQYMPNDHPKGTYSLS